MKIFCLFLSTFIVFLAGNHFAFASENLDQIAAELSADKESLEQVGGMYYIDKNKAYNRFQGDLPNVNPNSFVVLEKNSYAKDSKDVFYDGVSLEIADPDTFELDKNFDVVGYDSENYFLGSDKVLAKKSVTKVLSNQCFLVNKLLIRCYKSNLITGIESIFSGKKTGELQKIKNHIYKDDKYVYNFESSYSSVKEGIISDTSDNFQILNNTYLKDNDTVFYFSSDNLLYEIKETNSSTFKVYKKDGENGHEFASDGEDIYFKGYKDSKYSADNFDINEALQKKNGSHNEITAHLNSTSSQDVQKISFIKLLHSFSISFITFLISFHIILKNKKVTLNFGKKILAVTFAIILLSALGYVLSIFLGSMDSLLYSIISSVLGAGMIMGITKFLFKKDNINLLVDSLYLGTATIVLSVIIGFIFTILFAGILVGKVL